MLREVQINKNLKLREDGKLFNIHTGEEYISRSYRGSKTCQYLQVRIGTKKWTIHQLVMKYFGEPCPGPEYEIDHIDRNTKNNNINNLRWVTRQENIHNRKSSLPVGQRLCDFEDPKEYYRIYERNRRKKKKEGG